MSPRSPYSEPFNNFLPLFCSFKVNPSLILAPTTALLRLIFFTVSALPHTPSNYSSLSYILYIISPSLPYIPSMNLFHLSFFMFTSLPSCIVAQAESRHPNECSSPNHPPPSTPPTIVSFNTVSSPFFVLNGVHSTGDHVNDGPLTVS